MMSFTPLKSRVTYAIIGLSLLASQNGAPIASAASVPPPTSMVALQAPSYNCVDEVYGDVFWKDHMDAFAGAGPAKNWGSTAASRGWKVDASSPKVGDVVVWGDGVGQASSDGHVAIAVQGGNGVDKVMVRERNWPTGSPTNTRLVTIVSGLSFVHKPVSFRTEQYQSGSRQEQYQSGSRQEQYQSGSRQEQYQSGSRQEQYQCGWHDHWVIRNWRLVNDRQPAYCTRTVPVYSTRTVPVYSTRTVPVYSTRTVPVY